MVRSRVYGILAGYEDQNDHDRLRGDAVFQLVAGCSPQGRDLASQPTLSRFENAVTARELLNLEQWFLDRFVASFDEPPAEITLDIDAFDDPAHGRQQLVLFHGFYGQFNRRRQADPLGEGHACTWRMMIIKVASRIVVQARCVRVYLPSNWPYLSLFYSVGAALLGGP